MKKIGIGFMLAGFIIALFSVRSQLVSIFLMLKTVISLKLGNPTAIAVIGGADGPTSIFVAGKVSSLNWMAGAAVGVVLLAAGVVLIWKKRK